jgi:hypothetical protein
MNIRRFFSIRVAAMVASVLSTTIGVTAHAAGPVSWDTVAEIGPSASGWVTVKMASATDNPDMCGGTGYTSGTYRLLSSQTNYDAIYRALLAAQMSGRQVSLYVSGCSGGGTTGTPLVWAATVR